MTFILDVGGDQDVVTFTNVHEAWKALDAAAPTGRLYICKAADDWLLYNASDNHWYATNSGCLSAKVIQAGAA